MAPTPEETKQNVDLPKIDSQSTDHVGIDASIAKAGAELCVSLALDPATVTTTEDHLIVLDETFTETDDSGKQLSLDQRACDAFPPKLTSANLQLTRLARAFNGYHAIFHSLSPNASVRTGCRPDHSF